MHSTLEKIKNKVGRRSSEPAVIDRSLSLSPLNPRSLVSTNPVIIVHDDTPKVPSNFRLRAHSITNGADNLSTHRSASKKLTRELIKQETSSVIDKKLHQLLSELGLQHPFPLKTSKSTSSGSSSKSVKVSVANTNDCIYLALSLSASFTYADVENGGADVLEALAMTDAYGRRDSNGVAEIAARSDPSLDSVSNTDDRIQSFRSPQYLCTKIDSDTPIPHVFAVVVELTKECAIRDFKIDFLSCVQILWPLSDIHNRSHLKEKFKIGLFEWNTSLANADFYINTQNSSDTKNRKIDHQELAERTQHYKLTSVHDLAEGVEHPRGVDLNNSTSIASDAFSLHSSSGLFETYKAGLYVFLVPILFPPHMPASIVSVNGSLNHKLSVSMTKSSEKFNRRSKIASYYNLPMVRTPPSFANSIADKPIYVNRVWNDALQYVITFPRKYISLGSEHTINVKLVPLVKDVILKRIKFNVLERITYVSKDLRREYEYDDEDPYLLKKSTDNKTRERVVHVCELRTRHKSSYTSLSEPYKEEVIKCPDNNLLFSCYEPNDDPALQDPLSRPLKSTMVTSPLDINIALPFLTTRSDKIMQTSSVEDAAPFRPKRSSSAIRDSVLGQPLCPSSPVIGSLETHISHQPESGVPDEIDENELKLDSSAFMNETNRSALENIQQGFTSISKALAPDSNFRHIQVSHRLQVCFRISKPDPKDNYRMHHYEVVVDTPVVLLSAKCNEESIQLPQYDEINHDTALSPPPPSQRGITFRTPSYNHNGVSIRRLDPEVDEELPTFEEAISATASPRMRSFSVAEDPLSRSNSIKLDAAPSYENSIGNAEDYIPPLNIDDLVVDPKAPNRPRKKSSLRDALTNSFAPPAPRENSVSDLQDPLSRGGISDLTSEDTSSGTLDLSSSLGEVSGAKNPVRDDQSSISSHATRDNPEETGTESIFTQETNFEQKLPLLQNTSTENVNPRRPQSNLAKMLTQTLNEGQLVQEFYHAY